MWSPMHDPACPARGSSLELGTGGQGSQGDYALTCEAGSRMSLADSTALGALVADLAGPDQVPSADRPYCLEAVPGASGARRLRARIQRNRVCRPACAGQPPPGHAVPDRRRNFRNPTIQPEQPDGDKRGCPGVDRRRRFRQSLASGFSRSDRSLTQCVRAVRRWYNRS